MLDLLSKYSIQDILIFLVVLALAFKGIVSFIEWIFDKINKGYNKKYQKDKHEENINEQINNLVTEIKEIKEEQQQITNQYNDLSKEIKLLILSDKDDIKAYITEKHHYFCYEQGWVDDYTLDCIERRYSHYQEEGGNSFIKDLMNELRELPKLPPQE